MHRTITTAKQATCEASSIKFRVPAKLANLSWKRKPSSRSLSTTGSSPRLPTEICESIIEHVLDDPHAMSACSLTCREWVYGIRFHRFNKVSLREYNLSSFVALLKLSPDIEPVIRQLILDFSWMSMYMHFHHRDVLDKIFSLLKGVESLTLNSLVITPSIISALSKLSTVRRLEVGQTWMASTHEHMTALPRAFPLLTHLAMKGTLYVHPLALRVVKPFLRLVLETLYPNYPNHPFQSADKASSRSHRLASTVYEYLLRESPVVIGNGDFSHASHHGFKALLLGTGPSLEDLSLNLLAIQGIGITAFEPGMTECTNVRNIAFYGAQFGCALFAPSWIPKFLSLIKTNSIRTLSFHVVANEPKQVDALRFLSALPAAIAHEHFCHMERIVFYIDGQLEDLKSEAEEFIRTLLPELDVKGLLCFRRI